MDSRLHIGLLSCIYTSVQPLACDTKCCWRSIGWHEFVYTYNCNCNHTLDTQLVLVSVEVNYYDIKRVIDKEHGSFAVFVYDRIERWFPSQKMGLLTSHAALRTEAEHL